LAVTFPEPCRPVCCDTTTNPNISADPNFLSSPNNEFHLALSSPALDAGDNSTPNLPAADYANNPRVEDANGDGTSVVDLGAYELVATSSANLAPAALNFATQVVGTTSAAQTITLSSTGAAAFQVTSVQVSAPFAASSTCPVLGAPGDSTGIPGGSTCAYNVTFRPATSGVVNGRLTINGTNGASLVVALSGNWRARSDRIAIS
jgi:hypothetical protein